MLDATQAHARAHSLMKTQRKEQEGKVSFKIIEQQIQEETKVSVVAVIKKKEGLVRDAVECCYLWAKENVLPIWHEREK